MKTWTQCDLKEGNGVQTVWIETEFAKKGYILLSEEDGLLYKVIQTYSTMPDSDIKQQERKNLVFKRQLK